MGIAGDASLRWPRVYLVIGVVALAVLGVGLSALPGLGSPARQVSFDVVMLAIPLVLAATLHAASPASFWARRMTITRGRAALWIFLGSTAGGMAAAVYVVAFDVHGRTWLTGEHPRGGAAVVLGVCAVTLAPVAEEVFWRGLVHRALRVHLAMWPAVAVSSTMFGLAHWFGGDDFSTVVPRIFYGALLALLLERTHSLYPGIVAHAYINVAVLDLFVPSLAAPAFFVVLIALIAAVATSVHDPRRKKFQSHDDSDAGAAALRARAARQRAHDSGRLGTW
ncbi:MAG: protease family protein [Solirubrobacteraceae bacterium]|jgi:membrane protease YdiL (CAAX protease family)|nr:protease family protein [Solirubrobacteraceae bacterium]